MAVIQGTEGPDNLVGTSGDDQIFGKGGDDIINGGDGNDTLYGGAGADRFIGGAGNDTVSYTDAGAGITLNFKTGVHTGIAAGDTFESIEVFQGSNYADTFISDARAQKFNGGLNDTMDYSLSEQAVKITVDGSGGTGQGGDAEGDTFTGMYSVIGSSQNDTFIMQATGSSKSFAGGAGNDTYYLYNTAGVFEQAGGGIDEVRTTLASYTLTPEVENLTYIGTGNFTGVGNASDNIITGGSGNDVMRGGAGADRFIGGAGNDTVSYTDAGAGITLNFKTGVHTGIAAGDTFDSIEVFQGSNYADTFISDARAHTFEGGLNDTMDYSLSEQAVKITVDGSGGTGQGGDAEGDKFTGMYSVIGSSQNDTFIMQATGSSKSFAGGAGNDTYYLYNTAGVFEQAGGGIDEVRTTLASYTLTPEVENLTYIGTGNFTGVGNASDNIITGGSGNDVMRGGAGADRFIGGAGNDTVSYTDAGAGITLNFKTGVHTGIAAGDTFDSIEVFQGSNYADTFISDARAHTFEGGLNDTMDYSLSEQAVKITVDGSGGTGQGGDAEGDKFTGMYSVIGSSQNDTFIMQATGSSKSFAGGAGNDTYYLYNTAGVFEQAGGGIDEVRTTLASYTLTPEVENLTYIGTGNFTGVGNASDNIITGGSGNDVMRGGAGADRFIGGAGNDTVSYTDAGAGITLNFKTGVHTGIAAGDTFDSIEVFQGSNYADTFISDARAHTFEGGLNDTMDYSLSEQAVTITIDNTGGKGQGGDAEGDKFTGMYSVIGSSQNDTFIMQATGSSKSFAGGAGDDVYYLHNTAGVFEQAGGGIDEVRTTLASYTLTPEVENLTYIGTGNFTGVGNASDNIITGGSGNDVMRGGAGADRFIGGAGNDTVSYTDAGAGITLNFKTGVHTGIAAGDTFDSIEVFQGSNYADTFISDARAHTFEGGLNDTLDYSLSEQAVKITIEGNGGSGQGGDAEGDKFTGMYSVIGSSQNDTFIMQATGSSKNFAGGAGDDVYYLYSTAGVVEQAGGGIDEVRTTLANYTLTNEVENLTFIGTGNFTGYGNASNNVIVGGAGNDTLFGGAGADRFVGGAGIDTVSYGDSSSGILLNLKTGQHGGIAEGDTFEGIEKFVGSSLGDVFVANDQANDFNGAGGVDLLTFAGEGAGITLDLNATGNDLFTSIESFEGTAFNDTFIGTAASENFIGGAGADVINGGAGRDSAWYISSNASVSVDLATGVVGGGHAEGDVLSGIEGVAGSAFADVLNGDAGANTLYGAEGDDVINGGAGNDILYGDGIYSTDFGALARPANTQVAQADTINGGDGDDTITGALNDTGSIYHGDAGNDTIQTANGKAYGDDGNDRLVGNGYAYELYGGAGADRLDMMSAGYAFGGEGSDIYTIYSKAGVVIQDTGTAGIDVVVLKNIQTFQDVVVQNDGVNAYIFSKADWNAGNLDSGVMLSNWYAGSNTIESFQTNNGDTFTIT